MKTSIFAFSFLFIFPSLINAQYKELLKNDDITWIAEFEMDLNFDSKQMKNSLHSNVVTVKKSNEAYDRNSNWLTQRLFEMMVKGEVLAYRTSELNTPYSMGEIFDKTFTYDTTQSTQGGFVEGSEIKKKEIDPATIQSCRTRQIIYFNQKTGDLSTALVAIAPLLTNLDEMDIPVNKMPFGWIKMEDLFRSRINTSSSNVNWAVSINTVATPLDFSRLRVVKGGLDFRGHLYNAGLKSTHTLEESYNSQTYLSSSDVKQMYDGMRDTVVIFDPRTYEEKVKVTQNSITASDFNAARLVQEWYFIPSKQLLVNRLKAIAPLVKVRLEDEREVYERAVFYIRY